MDRRTLILAGLGALTPTARAQTSGKSFALLVGVEQYESPDVSQLKFAVKDVTAVAQALRERLGFATVRLLTSDTSDARLKPTNVNVFKALDNLATEIGPEDTFVFYFSGHGFSKEGMGFLGSVNVDPSSIETLQISSVPVETLQGKLKKIKARQVILIMDACRNDPEAGKGDGDNKLTGEFAKSLGVVARSAGEGGGSAVLFACSEGERAFEEPSFGHSVFTHFLLEGLTGKASSLSVEDVTSYTAGKVAAWAKERGKKQTPDAVKFGTGKVVFSPRVLAAPGGDANFVVKQTVGRLVFAGLPVGASVTVDGKPVVGDAYEEDMSLEKRSVDVVASAPGFKRLTGSTTLERGKALRVNLPLEKLPAPAAPARPAASKGKFVSAASKARETGCEQLARYLEQMQPIPGGAFQMGDDDDEKPVHLVMLSDYWLGRTPVPQELWKEYASKGGGTMAAAPSWGWLANHPIVNVSWDDIQGFCKWASKVSGLPLTLPTEAQWEFAARGGGKDVKWPWGNAFDGTKLVHSVGSTKAGRTAPVNRTDRLFVVRFSNGASVVDMSGNVWQWCQDYYGPYSSDAQSDPTGLSSGTWRVLRGGSWVISVARDFRCALRLMLSPGGRNFNIGFRLASPGP